MQTAPGLFAPGSLDLIHQAFLAPALLTTNYPALLAILSSQVLTEVQQSDFCGLCYLLTVRGRRSLY